MTPLMCQKCLLFIMCVGMPAHVLYAYEFAGVCVPIYVHAEARTELWMFSYIVLHIIP